MISQHPARLCGAWSGRPLWRRGWGILAVCISLKLILSVALAAVDAPPPITFSVQPEEGGKIVFLPVAPESEGLASSGLLGLRLNIANNGGQDLNWNRIKLIFTQPNATTFSKQFDRAVTLPAGGQVANYLSPSDPDERVRFAAIPPVSVRIEIYVDGYTQPRAIQRSIVPYVSPAPGGKYLFPANASDLGTDQYFSHIDPHTGGSQFFGYDFSVQGWNGSGFSSVKAGGDSHKNEDRVGWGIPIYAMADGVLLHVERTREDNPEPDTRVIQRMADAAGPLSTEAKVTRISSGRVATVARNASGLLEIRIWDLLDRAQSIVPRGIETGQAASSISIDALDASLLVTASRGANGNLKIQSWSVSADGTNVLNAGFLESGPAQEVSLMKLSSERFVTLARVNDGTLRVAVWEVASGGKRIQQLDQEAVEAGTSLSIVSLRSERLAVSFRSDSGRLKLIVFNLDTNGQLTRRGQVQGDSVARVLSSRLTADKLVTSARTGEGLLHVYQWTISAEGSLVSLEREAIAGGVLQISAPTVHFESTVITAVVNNQGHYQSILWRQPDVKQGEDEKQLYRWGGTSAGNVSEISQEAPEDDLVVSAVRTAEGSLKLISWWLGNGGGNNVVLLHGNCRVLYAHFRAGSVNPALTGPGVFVPAGTMLGRMGNSGSSSGPHTHIHSERVPSLMTLAEILAAEQADTLELQGFRPLPFDCARAMRMSQIKTGGESNPANHFSTVKGQGFYFASFGIRPAWQKGHYVDFRSTCLAPTGSEECTVVGPIQVGGPFRTVTQALSDDCWAGTLFVRSGAYAESVVFNRSMTVRAYDGNAVVGTLAP